MRHGDICNGLSAAVYSRDSRGAVSLATEMHMFTVNVRLPRLHCPKRAAPCYKVTIQLRRRRIVLAEYRK